MHGPRDVDSADSNEKHERSFKKRALLTQPEKSEKLQMLQLRVTKNIPHNWNTIALHATLSTSTKMSSAGWIFFSWPFAMRHEVGLYPKRGSIQRRKTHSAISHTREMRECHQSDDGIMDSKHKDTISSNVSKIKCHLRESTLLSWGRLWIEFILEVRKH